MATLRDYFVSESKDYFGQLNEQLNRLENSRGDPRELLRLARALRGSANLAREARVYRAGLGLEAAARAVTSGKLEWNADIAGRARRTVEDLQALATGEEANDDADARVKRVLDRWKESGVQLPTDVAQAGPPAPSSEASKQFREFAAHEVSGIVAEIDSSLTQLTEDPRNRDTLKSILRRQRALLGSARLGEIGVVAETLRAIEDLVRVIHKLNVAVKDEWATVFRAARDVLNGSLDSLKQGNDPSPTPALSKLRTLRAELVERYGEGEVVPVTGAPPSSTSATTPSTMPAAAPSRPQPAAPPATPPRAQPAAPGAATVPPRAASAPQSTPTPAAQPIAAAGGGNPSPPAAGGEEADRVVPIEELCYSGERALRRALELRPDLENLAGDDSDKREMVEEVFDLIRLGCG